MLKEANHVNQKSTPFIQKIMQFSFLDESNDLNWNQNSIKKY